MATHESTVAVTLIAEEALTIGTLVEVTATGTASVADATTDVIAGVVGETVGAGDGVAINQLQGVLEVLAGGAITAGQLVVPTAAGAVTGVASIAAIPAGSMAIGIALSDAASGDIFEVLGMPLASTL